MPELDAGGPEAGRADARLVEALREVYDPCCAERGLSVVDLGLVRAAVVRDGAAHVELLLTTGWCPFAARVVDGVRDRLEALPGIAAAEVDVVWDEAWTTDRLSERARRTLQFLPLPVTVTDRDAYVAASLRPTDEGSEAP
jgi:metal-sulfur cluster biosynthetic enzyme